jgi:hypothetical protein
MAQNNVVAMPNLKNVKVEGLAPTPTLKDGQREATDEEAAAIEQHRDCTVQMAALKTEQARLSGWLLCQFENGVECLVSPPYKCTRVQKKPSKSKRFDLDGFLKANPHMFAEVLKFTTETTGATPDPYILVT